MARYLMCPKCGGYFHMTMGWNPVILGPGARICGSCKTQFRDGSVEWNDATGWQKLNYLLPHGFKLFAILMLSVPFIGRGRNPGHSLIHDIAIGLKLVLTFWVPYGLFAAYNIYRSRQRK